MLWLFVHKFIDAPVRKTTDEKQCGRKVFELWIIRDSKLCPLFYDDEIHGSESGEFNFPGREFWHPLQSFPEIHSTLTVKARSRKFFSFQ